MICTYQSPFQFSEKKNDSVRIVCFIAPPLQLQPTTNNKQQAPKLVDERKQGVLHSTALTGQPIERAPHLKSGSHFGKIVKVS